MKKVLALLLASSLFVTALAGCSSSEEETTTEGEGTTATGSVYYLNFKPEQDGQWQELAEIYTAETGVEVVVQTAASGTYESTLKSEMAKTEAPTLFQVNGPVGLASWKDYAYDLTGSDVVSLVSSEDFLLKDGDMIAGIGYVIETYGLIYNKALLEEAGYTEADITDFDSLKAVAEDITARQDELGFAAFTSAGMDGSSDWRFKTHLANIPLYYEYQADGIGSTEAVKGTYLDEYRQIWDLYINNSTTSPSLLSTKTGEDAVAEFILGEGVFYQNGTWEYNNALEIGEENIGMLPIYIGVEGEENQGLCTGTENYWVVNNNASQEDIDATLAFMNWCVSSETGVTALCGGEGAMPSGDNGMGFVIPFTTNLDSSNTLVNIANEYVAAGKTSVTWNFPTMPSEQWKNDLGSALTTYAADQTDANWDAVVSAYVDGWVTEYQAANG